MPTMSSSMIALQADKLKQGTMHVGALIRNDAYPTMSEFRQLIDLLKALCERVEEFEDLVVEMTK